MVNSDLWKNHHTELIALASEEKKIRQGRPERLSLMATGNYPDEGLPFSLLEKSEYGWVISSGPGEDFLERFNVVATRAGGALGPPQGTKPIDFWLHRLYRDLLENDSRYLWATVNMVTEKQCGGTIPLVCEASAIFCSRLEKEALETEGKRKEEVAITPLEKLRGLVSISQRQAADELCVTTRTIRNYRDQGKLNGTTKCRILIDSAFEKL